MNKIVSFPTDSYVVRPTALRIKQAANYCGFSVGLLWKLIRDDAEFSEIVKPFKVGGLTLLMVAELDAYLKLRATKATALKSEHMRRVVLHREKHDGEFDPAKAKTKAKTTKAVEIGMTTPTAQAKPTETVRAATASESAVAIGEKKQPA